MDGENAMNLRNFFAVFKPIGKYSKCERLRLRNCFVATRAVSKNTWKAGDFADPAAILFSLNLNGEIAHSVIVQLRSFIRKFAVQRIRAKLGRRSPR
jgi:hypothetical protein